MHNIGAMVVVSPDGLVGIVSERDVVRKLHELGAELLRRPVSEIMTTMVATCTPDDSVDHLSALMTEKRVRHIPVVVDGRLAGIVSIGDVVKTRMEELEAQQEQLQAYITQGSLSGQLTSTSAPHTEATSTLSRDAGPGILRRSRDAWMLPDDDRRAKGLPRMFAAMTRHHFLPRGGVEVALAVRRRSAPPRCGTRPAGGSTHALRGIRMMPGCCLRDRRSPHAAGRSPS